jgi:opacity protein-like surface antigen
MVHGRAGSRRAAVGARVILLTACWTVVPTARVHADWLITPFIGTTFGISTAFQDFEGAASSKHVMFGGSFTWLSDGIIGVEGEYAHAPRFFESDEGERFVLSSQVTTFSGHFMVAAPLVVTGDSLRPFVLAGLGVVHSKIDLTVPVGVTDNSLGLQLGGGAIGFVSNRAALRFDLRHVRTLRRRDTILAQRETKLSFWRAAIGVAIRY